MTNDVDRTVCEQLMSCAVPVMVLVGGVLFVCVRVAPLVAAFHASLDAALR